MKASFAGNLSAIPPSYLKERFLEFGQVRRRKLETLQPALEHLNFDNCFGFRISGFGFGTEAHP
jgi:hypothetical protein